MKPNVPSLEQQLARLEREVNDDFHLMQEGGMGYFSTEELRDLLLSWRLRFQIFQRFHYLINGFGLASPFMFLLGCSIYKMGALAYAQKVFFLVPCCTALFLAGRLWIRRKYHSREIMENYGKNIQEELQKRRRQRDTMHF